jgi:hypothetical protein
MAASQSWVFAILTCLAVLTKPPAHATEGGASHYVPGTYNDFAAGVFGQSGLYFRNDFFAYHGEISKAPIGGRLFNDVDQRVWMNSLKFSLLTDWGFIGARYGATFTLPIMLYGFAEGFLELEGQRRDQDDRTGIGDLYVAPIQLNWHWADHHLTFSQGVYLPTGSYDRHRVINLGRNYWSFDSNLTYTWLSQTRGHEVTFNAGYLLNTRNTASDYRSGNEFHVDFLFAQHFTSHFAVGVPGYWYKQVTGDDADMLDQLNLGSFRGEAAGLGLALLFKPAVAGKDVNVVLKWVHDIHARRRFEGSEIMLSVAFKLSR